MEEEKANGTPKYVWPPRTAVEVEDMVQDAFARADEIQGNVVEQNSGRGQTSNTDNALNVDDDNMEELIHESTQPLYDGCSINCLQAGIVIMNMCNIHGMLHAFLDELLSFMALDLLPWANCLLCITYETK